MHMANILQYNLPIGGISLLILINLEKVHSDFSADMTVLLPTTAPISIIESLDVSNPVVSLSKKIIRGFLSQSELVSVDEAMVLASFC